MTRKRRTGSIPVACTTILKWERFAVGARALRINSVRVSGTVTAFNTIVSPAAQNTLGIVTN